jgi:dipeptidyl-peptidase 4
MKGFVVKIRIDVMLYLAICVLSASASCLLAQGSAADYERANNLGRTVGGKVFKKRISPQWFKGDEGAKESAGFWYRNDLAGGKRQYVIVDAVKGTRRIAFDHSKLAKALGESLKQKIEADRLPVDAIALSGDAKKLHVVARGKAFELDLGSYSLAPRKRTATKQESKPRNTKRRGSSVRQNNTSPRRSESPDGKWRVVTKEHNLYLEDRKSKAAVQLTADGKDRYGYSSGVYWSYDSKYFVATRTKQVETRRVHFVESSPRDRVQPKLHTRSYAKPGDAMSVTKPHLFSVLSKKQVAVSDELFKNPWRIDAMRWLPDSSAFTFRYNQRGHAIMRVVTIDPATGVAKSLINEDYGTFYDYSNKSLLTFVKGTNEIIWMSESSGWNHLYLINAKSGKVINPITKGKWLIKRVLEIDEEKRLIWFQAMGVYPKQDPYHVHYGRVNFDGTGLTWLTAGDGTHEIQYSPDRSTIIDTYSRVDMPHVHELRRVSDGKLLCELERADISALLDTGWNMPERFVAKGRDDKTDIWGVIYRPMVFDAKKKYPVIEHIYAGPHGHFVPKRFSEYHGSNHAMAELGFITVKIDGMGTNWRSRAFHDVASKNVGDAGLPDRIKWIKAAEKKRPFMDITRVGIYGGSAGGQSSTGALLQHPEFYDVAVSDCGCHDNRMDKIWWNEAWMGWPVGKHYREQSNVINAHKLQGKLFLIVGEMDTNVDPASTMQVVNALIKANKDFDLLVIPGGGHGIGGRYGVRRRRDFFVRHLLHVEPRWTAK